jgi:ferrochelatase
MSTAILLVNLGTPDSPAPRDVYRYLIEFLTDERVLGLSWLKRQLLVRGFIVPTRCKASAKAYSTIWTKEGSPLMTHSVNLKNALQQFLGKDFHVALAMRYQTPTIANAIKELLAKNPEHLIVLPLFPQYASATTGSVHQKVMEVLKTAKFFPKLTFLNHFAVHPALIAAYKEIASNYSHADYDHVLFSFHGLPKKQLSCLTSCCQNKGNCYSAQCYGMTQALIASIGIPKEKCSISFQSRLGKDPWLEPFTSNTLQNLAASGKKRVLVFSPSFVCDCLETIFEIGEECNQEFLHAGGEKLQLVPGLNSHPAWVKALAGIIYSCSSSH